MYRRYYDVWREHADRYGPRTALLYQVGGFFELYDTENLTTGATQANIREIAETCQLSLTVKEVAGDGTTQTLFGGVPEYTLAKYERILVGAGYTVVVVVQRKGRSGAVEERVVDHISSPGCFVEGAGAGGPGRERRLVGVVLESATDGPAALRRCYWAAAALDLATGRIWFVEGQAPDRLHQFLCMHPPSELVIWSDGGAAAGDLVGLLREATGAAACHVKCLAAASVAVEEATLERFWAPVRLRLEWIGRLPQARRAMAALMEFAAEHVPSALRSIAVPEAWIPTGEMRLGNAALEQLGMLSLGGGGSDRQSLLGLMDQCRSVAGRRLMRERLLRPICDRAELERRLDRVDAAGAALGDTSLTALTERCLRSLYDMSRLWRRLELGTASVGDLACLLRSWEAARALMDAWPGAAVPAGVREFVDWALGHWSVGTLTTMAREGVSVPVAELPWAPGTQLVLEAQFAGGRAIRAEAEALCGLWSGLGRGETLYLDDAEGGGFRITGTKRRVAAVLTVLCDEGDTTAMVVPYKATASLETAGLSALSERHRAWMAGWSMAWGEAWAAGLAEIVGKGGGRARALEAWCAELDLSWTVARLARDWLWRRPVFEGGEEPSRIAVENLRHPILERLVTVPYVPHTVALGSGQSGMLLYGMNASGKSSLMKAIGLCVLLAQSGFPVPASACRLVPFTALMTRILGNDNLWAGQSSFVVEMTELREILRFADARSLVLGDELCKGTESLSATALVASAVEELTRRGAKFVFATHLHELATLPDITGLGAAVRALHLRVEYDAATDRLVYGRDLLPGAGSALYGLEVCRALDLPAGWLDRATVIRQSLAGWQPTRQSGYSAAAVVGSCQVCGATGAAARLETHHIRPQAESAAAAATGVDIHAAGNLVCLCAVCHDDHHAGRLVVEGWEETSAGRRLRWTRSAIAGAGAGVGALLPDTEELHAWIREQRMRKITIARIQAVGKQLFGVELTRKEIQSVR